MLGDYFAAQCTMVQGDHDPQWKVDFTADNSGQVVLNSSFSDGLYATQLNLYQNELQVYVNNAHEGIYTCQSSVSGLKQQFILTASRCPIYSGQVGVTTWPEYICVCLCVYIDIPVYNYNIYNKTVCVSTNKNLCTFAFLGLQKTLL